MLIVSDISAYQETVTFVMNTDIELVFLFRLVQSTSKKFCRIYARECQFYCR